MSARNKIPKHMTTIKTRKMCNTNVEFNFTHRSKYDSHPGFQFRLFSLQMTELLFFFLSSLGI